MDVEKVLSNVLRLFFKYNPCLGPPMAPPRAQTANCLTTRHPTYFTMAPKAPLVQGDTFQDAFIEDDMLLRIVGGSGVVKSAALPCLRCPVN